MFSLMAGFYEQCFSKPTLHVLIIGVDHAGKTTLLESIKSQFTKVPGLPAHRIVPTVGMNLGKIQYSGAEVIFWDLGGQSRMRGVWEKYYQEASAVVFVVDSADPDRLVEVKKVFEITCAAQSLADVPIMVFANKQDLPGAVPADALARQWGLKDSSVFGVSGITRDGLESAIGFVVARAKEFKQFQLERMAGGSGANINGGRSR